MLRYACRSPAYLRQCFELSRRRLKVEAIDLCYLHRIDPSIFCGISSVNSIELAIDLR
ncbi:aldo/keto reductase [Pseudomonas sp. NPDC047961]